MPHTGHARFQGVGRPHSTKEAGEQSRPEGGGDYYDLRITADEIRSKGKDQAQVDALKRIQIRATAKAAAEVGLGTVKEFGAGACVGLAAIGFANSWNPFGWGCLLLGGGLALWGAYDFYQASQIWKAATAAQATYGNPDNVVP